MKKQITFLSILLVFFLLLIAFCCYELLTMDLEPDIPESYVEYEEFKDKVTFEENKVEPDPSDPSTAPTEPQIFIDVDVDELYSINQDFDSWLYIPDTEISYPVVWREDDNFYYLKRSFKGKQSGFGCLYFDAQSSLSAKNRVIHGHNMGVNRTEMFSTLVEYQEQEYADSHKYAYLAWDSEIPAAVYRLFAVVNFDITAYPELDYAQPFFDTQEEYDAFVSFFREHSIYETDFVPTEKLLIFSTCNREFGSKNRLLICFGKVDNPPPADT